MGYDIQCRECGKHTIAANIVVLLDDHTNEAGRFVCQHCAGTDTFIHRESRLQEKGEIWNRWIKGVIRINTGTKTYSPYIFLTARSESEWPTSGLHFHYYKDTRDQEGGKLKHGHGPGGPPVLENEHLFDIMSHLVSVGALTKARLIEFVRSLPDNR